MPFDYETLKGWQFEPVVARSTLASAIQIGNPVSVRKAIRTLQRYDGIVEQATESELVNGRRPICTSLVGLCR